MSWVAAGCLGAHEDAEEGDDASVVDDRESELVGEAQQGLTRVVVPCDGSCNWQYFTGNGGADWEVAVYKPTNVCSNEWKTVYYRRGSVTSVECTVWR
jgi:hypothetical protein